MRVFAVSFDARQCFRQVGLPVTVGSVASSGVARPENVIRASRGTDAPMDVKPSLGPRRIAGR